jgi:hypothetical protein
MKLQLPANPVSMPTFSPIQAETNEDFRQLIRISRRSNTRMVKVFGNCRQLTKEDLEQKHYEME